MSRPGTPAPPPPNIHVNPGNSGNASITGRQSKCKHDFLRRHGKCEKARKNNRQQPEAPPRGQDSLSATTKPNYEQRGDCLRRGSVTVSAFRARPPPVSVPFSCCRDVRRPARPSEAIESFSTNTSTTQAGGHPDLETSFTLKSNPEIPKQPKRGLRRSAWHIRKPNAISHCTASLFALDQCPSDSQAGLITVQANYEGNPNICSARRRSMTWNRERRNRPFRVHHADPRHTDLDPRRGADPGDYGLRFTVADITQCRPLAERR